MIEKEQWYKVNEKSRIYYFPDNQAVAIEGVSEVRVSRNHTHFIKTASGKNHIIRNTWLAVVIDGEFID